MTAKKIMGIIALVFCGGIGLFIFMLYATIKTKSTNINTNKPFKEWVGQTVTLNRQTFLFEENIRMNTNGRYPYTLLDSLHPQWQYVEERKNLAEPDLVEITSFPTGTKLRIEKATQYTNGVSGSSYPTVFGTIHHNGQEYKIAYQWGTQDIGRRFDKIKESWKFHQAPWQTQQDTVHYALPDAKVW